MKFKWFVVHNIFYYFIEIWWTENFAKNSWAIFFCKPVSPHARSKVKKTRAWAVRVNFWARMSFFANKPLIAHDRVFFSNPVLHKYNCTFFRAVVMNNARILHMRMRWISILSFFELTWIEIEKIIVFSNVSILSTALQWNTCHQFTLINIQSWKMEWRITNQTIIRWRLNKKTFIILTLTAHLGKLQYYLEKILNQSIFNRSYSFS